MDNGNVLVEVKLNDNLKTKSGIIVGFNKDTLYSTDETDRSSHPADVAEIHGYVKKIPEKLIFDKQSDYTMDWKTDIEIEVGDEVWFDYLDSLNTTIINNHYLILPYQSLYVRRRGKKFLPLNGYCFFTIPEVEEMGIKKKDFSQGIVYMTSKPNKEYIYDVWRDEIDIKKGDRVRFNAHKTQYPVYLERLKEIASFPEMVVRAQRKDILFKF